jgi:hypothetical protein
MDDDETHAESMKRIEKENEPFAAARAAKGRAVQEVLAEASADDRQRTALEYLADPENWLGDPHSQEATLHGHDTPYELACRALGIDPDDA